MEHTSWLIEKRKDAWIPAANTERESRNNTYRLRNALFPWEQLTDQPKELDLGPVRNIPRLLALAGYEIIRT